MKNIFQRIGNNLEKQKLERKKTKDRYWKLSSVERIDYNMHLDKIEKTYEIIPLQLTILWLKILMYVTIFLGLFSFVFNVYDIMFNSIRLIWKAFIQLIWLFILLDMIALGSNSFGRDKQKNKLNKRFKLC